MVVNLIWPYKRNKIVGEMGVDKFDSLKSAAQAIDEVVF